jgi:hypothetical protein
LAGASINMDKAIKILEALSYVSAVITLIIIAFQLSRDATERRLSHSLELIDKYRAEPISTYRNEIDDFELAHRGEFALIARNGGLSPEDAATFLDSRITSYESRNPNKRIRLALSELVRFYESAELCVNRGICDGGTIREFLYPDAKNLYCSYGTIARRQAEIFGQQLSMQRFEQFVGKPQCT